MPIDSVYTGVERNMETSGKETTMNEHTKGPWNVGGDGRTITNGHLDCIAKAYASNSNSNADVRLIAAAPELLEALQLLLGAVKGAAEVRTAAAHAVAKATGVDVPYMGFSGMTVAKAVSK